MKTFTLYHPATIQNALSDFERYMESFFGDSPAPAGKTIGHTPAVDIRETDKAFILEMELPGYDEKTIDVHVDGSNLTITSKQEVMDEKKGDENGVYLIKERHLNSFSRSFKLPQNANPEAVNAAFKNGVLSLEIAKRAEAQKRMIQINAA